MTKFYTDSHYNPDTKEATFGVYCPSKNYNHCAFLPSNFDSSIQAEFAAIEQTVKIVKEQFAISEPDTRFEVHSDSERAIEKWGSMDHLPAPNIHVIWSPRDSAGIQGADRLAGSLNKT
jgi:hypothetical protein